MLHTVRRRASDIANGVTNNVYTAECGTSTFDKLIGLCTESNKTAVFSDLGGKMAWHNAQSIFCYHQRFPTSMHTFRTY